MAKNSKGFAPLQIVLLLVLVSGIVGTGWYVWQTKNKTSKSLDSTTQGSGTAVKPETKKEETKTPAKEEESWLLFEASDKAYSVRVPDGWDGIALYDNVYVMNASKLSYIKGTKAKIEVLSEGGFDGPTPFALHLPRQNYDQIVKEGTKQGEIKTSQGLIAEKYLYKEIKDTEAIGYQKGDTVYNYYFGKDGRYIQVTHYFSQNGTDQHEFVERLVKTIKVN